MIVGFGCFGWFERLWGLLLQVSGVCLVCRPYCGLPRITGSLWGWCNIASAGLGLSFG